MSKAKTSPHLSCPCFQTNCFKQYRCMDVAQVLGCSNVTMA